LPRPHHPHLTTSERPDAVIQPSQKACIVGVGESEYAKWGKVTDRSEFHLSCEAITGAAADAGLPVNLVDGFASFSDDANDPSLLMIALGTEQLRFSSMVWGGGGGGSCGAIAHAAAAVETGRADYVAVFRGLCQGQSFRFGQFHPWSPHSSFTAPFGVFAPSQLFALIAQRHMYQYGTTEDHLAEVAITCRDNATRNPRAVMGSTPLTVEGHHNSRMISDPLRLYDCCLESDGACAVIVTTRERARDLKQTPVDILAAQQGSTKGWGTGMLGGHNMPDEIYPSGNARVLAKELYATAGVTPDDIDVAQLYDAFTPTVLFALEDYGFCGVGESGAFVADGNIRWPNGNLPVNTSGGNLSEAYIHGFNLVAEGVRQMRGTSTSQVANASVGLVCAGESVTPTSAVILAAG
jgi:acetyl-CoA acetyltransferase